MKRPPAETSGAFFVGAGAPPPCNASAMLYNAPEEGGTAMTKRELLLYVAIPVNALIFLIIYAWWF